MNRILILIYAIALICVPRSSYADAKSCVISLLADSTLEQEIEGGPQTAVFKGLVGTVKVYQTLKACLEGEFEEVIIVAHSKAEIPGKASLLYAESLDDGKPKYLYLNDRFFRNIRVGPRLRVLTLAVCEAESVVAQYAGLRDMLNRSGVALKLAPISPVATWLLREVSGQDLKGIVPFRQALNLIVEAGQDSSSQTTVSCFVYNDPLQPGTVLCDRGHIQLKIQSTSSWRAGWIFLEKNERDGYWWLVMDAPPDSPRERIARAQGRGGFPLLPLGNSTFGNSFIRLSERFEL